MGKIVHVVLWKLKPSSTADSPSTDEFAEAKEAIESLKTVPGPELCHLGPPARIGRNHGYNWGLYSIFASIETLETYIVSEAHVKFVEHAKPFTEALLAYDFEIDQ